MIKSFHKKKTRKRPLLILGTALIVMVIELANGQSSNNLSSSEIKIQSEKKIETKKEQQEQKNKEKPKEKAEKQKQEEINHKIVNAMNKLAQAEPSPTNENYQAALTAIQAIPIFIQKIIQMPINFTSIWIFC